MQITYDKEADALYIKLLAGDHQCRVVGFTDDIALDLAVGEKLVKIELLGASRLFARPESPEVELRYPPGEPMSGRAHVGLKAEAGLGGGGRPLARRTGGDSRLTRHPAFSRAYVWPDMCSPDAYLCPARSSTLMEFRTRAGCYSPRPERQPRIAPDLFISQCDGVVCTDR